MNTESVVDIFKEATKAALLISFPLLISSLLVGLIISFFQAATQINEQSLSFIPKIISIIIIFIFLGPWMLNIMINYTRNIFLNLPIVVY
ncbi:flagellar biosynthesis protein FliQ [Buchnera aphidicola (Kurisakia onigurumii)]|uniref:flagellar biosynthesis protein FliQ n=1 Tax=Buchnera aphidicola TaxID=9 RepID=UPI0031B6EE6D